MWQDALRVCKEYIPHKLSALQDEYEREMMDKSTRGAETLIQQVRMLLSVAVEKILIVLSKAIYFLRRERYNLAIQTFKCFTFCDRLVNGRHPVNTVVL